MEKSKTKSKAKNNETYPLDIKISLDFSNNLFQTFIFEIFQKLEKDIKIENIKFEQEKIFNLIKIIYKEEYFFLQFYDYKFLTDSITNKNLFKSIEIFKNITDNVNNIIFLFFDITQRNFIDIYELVFFLNSHENIKVFECKSNNELFSFLENYLSSITNKEEKSKLTYFDIKPVTSTNLSEIENISDNSITWVKHLMCIPGVSELKAIAIVKEYPTFRSLIEIYESDQYTDYEKEKFLKEIDINNSVKNTKKRIGDIISSKIFKYFSTKDNKNS